MNPHIQLNPRICNGKPVIAGTRIPVTVILDQVIACGSIDRLLDVYPDLSREQVVGALRYCHDLIDHTESETQVA